MNLPVDAFFFPMSCADFGVPACLVVHLWAAGNAAALNNCP